MPASLDLPSAAPFVLLTDFGVSDPYVGQMKGRLLQLMPGATIVDLSHDVQPQNIEQAALFLENSHVFFPEHSTFLCVVDPGVGTERKILATHHENRYFLAPDNGLLPLAMNHAQFHDVTPGVSEVEQASTTFHGRDIFTVLATRLHTTRTLQNLGPAMEPARVTRIPHVEPGLEQQRIMARVIHVDHFGNCITSLRNSRWLPLLSGMEQVLLDTESGPVELALGRCYSDLETAFGLLPGSQQRLEIAANRASASTLLRLFPGQDITLHIP